MKRISKIAFLLFLLIGFIACSNQNEQTTKGIDPKMNHADVNTFLYIGDALCSRDKRWIG